MHSSSGPHQYAFFLNFLSPFGILYVQAQGTKETMRSGGANRNLFPGINDRNFLRGENSGEPERTMPTNLYPAS